MKGYLRSIYYWGYCMEKLFFSMLGTMLLVFAIFAFMGTNGEAWGGWICDHIPMLGIIFPVAEGMNMANMQVPLALSSGSTRKETAVGVIVMSHVIILQLLIFAVIGKLLFPMYTAAVYFKVCGILFLVSCGIGNGLGAIILRFGSKVGMSVYIVMIFLMAGGIAVISVSSRLDVGVMLTAGMGVFVAGVIFDVIMAAAFYAGIKRYEVRI